MASGALPPEPTMNIFSECLNSKKQGDIGMGYAIRYFSSNGTVSIPLTDSQDYDLIVDINDSLKRVQVKTTGQKNKEFFKVTLCTKGGNKSRYNIKQFDNKKMDILYCLTSDGKEYIIPTSEIDNKYSIALCDKYLKFLI